MLPAVQVLPCVGMHCALGSPARLGAADNSVLILGGSKSTADQLQA